MTKPGPADSGGDVVIEAARPRFSAEEHERRRQALRAIMDDHQLDAVLGYGTALFGGTIQYFTEYSARQPTWLVMSRAREPTLLLHFVNHVPNALDVAVVGDIQCYWPSAVDAVVDELVGRVGHTGRVGLIGAAAMPYGHLKRISAGIAGRTIVDVSRQLDKVRWIRSPEEITRIRQSGRIIDEACDLLAQELRPGMTELDAKSVLHSSFIASGAEEGIIYLASTSMQNPDRKSPWQFPTYRVMKPGDILISEITLNYFGYGGQIHRPFAVGASPNATYRQLFEVAVECFEQVRGILREGATSEEVQEAGMIVQERGFRLFDSLLHGETGRNPELGSSGSDHRFEPWTFAAGQVVILQPNPVTPDGTAGLQAGCALLIQRDGAIPLHGYPLRFPVCS